MSVLSKEVGNQDKGAPMKGIVKNVENSLVVTPNLKSYGEKV